MPDDAEPKSEVLRRQVGTVSSISFSRNAASYFPRPRLRSQTTMSIGAPHNQGVARIIVSLTLYVQHEPETTAFAAKAKPRSEGYTLPVELGRCRCSWGAPLTPLQSAPLLGLWCRRERPTNQDAARTKPRISDRLVRTAFRKATAPFFFSLLALAASISRAVRILISIK